MKPADSEQEKQRSCQMHMLERNYGLVMAYEVDTENPENPLDFSHCIEFPANHAKFEIKYGGMYKRCY